MPYQVIPGEVTRGSICKDRWRATVAIMSSDRIPAGAESHLLVDIKWRQGREGEGPPGQPEDAKPITLTFRKLQDSSSGDIRFDGDGGPATKGFNSDVRTLLTIYGQHQSASDEADVALDVKIEGDVEASIPLGVRPSTTSLEVRAEDGSGTAADYFLVGSSLTLAASVSPVSTGRFRWESVRKDALAITGSQEEQTVQLEARQLSTAMGDSPLCLVFTPESAPAILTVHRMTLAQARILLGSNPAPHLLGQGQTATFTAELRPAGLSDSVDWSITAGGTFASISGDADRAEVEVEGTATSPVADDVTLRATFHSSLNPNTLDLDHSLTVTSIALDRSDGGAFPEFVELGDAVQLRAAVTPSPLDRAAVWTVTADTGSNARSTVEPVASVALARQAVLTGTSTSTPHAHNDIKLSVKLRSRTNGPVASTAVEHRFTVVMGEPLNLFVPPPYSPDWTLTSSFGTALATGSARSHTLLDTTGAGLLLAAADGTLSVRPPRRADDAPVEEFVPPAAGGPLPTSVTLFLHLSQLIASNTRFSARAAGINNIRGFTYLNVETASLVANLAELLDHVELPPDTAGTPSRAEKVAMLLQGQVTVKIDQGHAIGVASTVGAAAGHRQAGFNVLTDRGPIDPSHAYDWMRDFVSDGQPAVDQFLALAPVRWPVIDPGLSVADAITATANSLFSWAVLDDLRTRRGLPAAQWRQVGNNQKAQWLRRLLRRSGHAPAANTDPPFQFNDEDWQNVFQLEALVEFYINFNDPWRPAPLVVGENQPRLPFQADGVTATPGYVTVNLLTGWHIVIVDSFGGRLSGTAATAAGNVLTLDGPPDLQKVNDDFDTVYLPSDVARASRTYRITAHSHAAHTVTLDGVPDLDGGSSAWQLPSGVSGELPPMAYNLGPGGARGYDHFDGTMFIVKDGQARGRPYRWSSYTSRNYGAGSQLLSSLRGNKRYDFSSFRSGNAFRNYSMKVVDHGAAYDGVREARFYFSTPVTEDVAPAGVNPDAAGETRGKSLIRLHHSTTNNAGGGCSSAGCVVSGEYYRFRSELVDLYEADYRAAHGGAEDGPVRNVGNAFMHVSSQNLYNGVGGPTTTAGQWNNRISGDMWVIRPDERPVG